MSSRACPAGAPAVTSLRPSRLATRVAGAAVGSPGTVIPASGAGPLLADAALTPSVPNAATAARPAPIPRARRRFVLLIMLIVLPGICGRCLVHGPVELYAAQRAGASTRNCGKAHSHLGEPNQGRIRGATCHYRGDATTARRQTLRSSGRLDVVTLAEEAGLKRNKLTHKHTDLKDLFNAERRARAAPGRKPL